MEPTPRIEARWLGRVDYDTARDLQISERDRVVARESPGYLFLLEHEPVVTVGRRGPLDDVLAPSEELGATGIAFRHAERGGRATYHGPGQLVGYPVAPLHTLAPDVPIYVFRLEETLIRVAQSLGIPASRGDGARGVWVADRKLASIGVAISRGVCWHGFALNVSHESLSGFRFIRPCGLDTPVACLADYVDAPSLVEVASLVAASFAHVCSLEESGRPVGDLSGRLGAPAVPSVG